MEAASKRKLGVKTMTKRNKAVLAVLGLLVLAGIFVFRFCSDREGFTGSRVKNPDAYWLDIQRMNGTDVHTMALHEGDVLHTSATG